ncbi:ABC transporter permease [Solobacterium sp.]|uniref:ABC transporter permease n=1 Tax=Solobacterium sp. TaxID=2060878 RepID=UPI001CB1E947|nr:ABC transporter permease [Solobacterium sp.]MBF1084042.1 ABC transporter permease [Solobacterium sp.]MBF1099207.1 ABC transporter permease [Solobacterium sp.]
MRGFLGLTKRNLLLFFKDKQSIIFSLLTSMIVLALYLLFLKDTFVNAMDSAINQFPGLSSLIDKNDKDMFANLILLTGILGSAMITVPYNCLITLVKDRENKVDYDILATPLKRGQIIFSYFVSAALSSAILTSMILAIGLGVIGMQGDIYLGTSEIVKAFGAVTLGSISATSIFMIVVLFFKSVSASGAFFGMLSAASGFIIGAYIPISQFSESVQTVCNIFPASQITIVLRNVLINGLLEHMNISLAGVDQGMFVTVIKELFSFKARIFGGYLDMTQMLGYITLSILVCIVIQIIVYSKTYKKV